MPFIIVRQDITKMQVVAIVNATNTDLQLGGALPHNLTIVKRHTDT